MSGLINEYTHLGASATQRRTPAPPAQSTESARKSVFADQLADVLREQARPVVRASVDDFHRPRVQRYRRGRNSPNGFWLDSFDYDRLRDDLLDPLGPGGSRRYRTAVHDFDTNRHLDLPWVVGPPGVVLVLDGLFLHRDELHDLWELSVFLDVPFAVTATRMAARDGSNPDPHHPSMRRYVDAQRTYLRSCSPAKRADLVIDNSDWDRPAVQPSSPTDSRSVCAGGLNRRSGSGKRLSVSRPG